DPGCLPDWSSYKGHCYKVFKKVGTWEDAEKFCVENSGHLASIDSKEEADFVTKLASQTLTKFVYDAWIGLRDESKTQQCSPQWTDGSSVVYENVDEPTKCFGLDVHTEYRTWTDLPCGEKNPFICKSRLPH
uniref:Snaclec bitiscetin subunit alpha n=1 Tax=Bitis arietans TaxID=8692 RepID=SLA_BITAR|nr:RecName: Full=Snaclec bitiscetin subunit alpha [Bitis arietans]1JWI_A Chain A, bitiscetin [Bitis arietans]1UEX_A Chain A, bitiscetin alpha chain [Bitis arietans]